MKIENLKIVQAFLKNFAETAEEKPVEDKPAEAAESTPTEVQLEDGTSITADKLEAGGVVMVGTDLANPGDYKTKDGAVITVGDNGVISAIVEATPAEASEETPAEETTEETEMAEGEYPWDQCIIDMTAEYGDAEIAKKVCGSIKAKGQVKMTGAPEGEEPAKEAEAEMSEETPNEFEERLETLERAFFAFAEKNKLDIDSIKNEVKLFSEKPATTSSNVVVEEKAKPSHPKQYSIGLNLNALKR